MTRHAPPAMVCNTAGDTPPEEAMSLCHVFGCRAGDRKGNLVLLLTGEAAFYTARVCIIVDATTRRQRIFAGHHTCDIIALALHPDGLTLASSDTSGSVLIWDAISLSIRARLSPGEICDEAPDGAREQRPTAVSCISNGRCISNWCTRATADCSFLHLKLHIP